MLKNQIQLHYSGSLVNQITGETRRHITIDHHNEHGYMKSFLLNMTPEQEFDLAGALARGSRCTITEKFED